MLGPGLGPRGAGNQFGKKMCPKPLPGPPGPSPGLGPKARPRPSPRLSPSPPEAPLQFLGPGPNRPPGFSQVSPRTPGPGPRPNSIRGSRWDIFANLFAVICGTITHAVFGRGSLAVSLRGQWFIYPASCAERVRNN